jgi:hypothetical protein
MITPDAQQAIDHGLAYLARTQQRDGSWGERHDGNVAITSLAGLAFLAGGHQPGRGPYGKVVTKAIQYVLSKETNQPPGFLYHPGGTTHGPMYSHGFATMFLAEAHGTIADRELRRRVRETLGRAVKVILDSQNGEGGWRYQPYKENAADISVTICQIMALRAARNAGVDVPKSAADRCTAFVKACQTTDGGFRYFRTYGPSGFARSAAGVVALYSAGVYQDPAIERGLTYLTQFRPPGQAIFRRDYEIHFYYGHYYAAQAMWTAGGNYWSDWFPAIRDELVARARQRGDSWNDATQGADYATAMACIILQIPNNYLPIMQK